MNGPWNPRLLKRGMQPIGPAHARLLILGTLPGDESLRRQQYYAHPQNQFWRLIASALGETAPADYGLRLAILDRHRIAVWDVLKTAAREGSLDSAIREGEPNDFRRFFRQRPDIDAVAFNGQLAAALFKRHVAPSLDDQARFVHVVLPSSSPAATRPFTSKLVEWRAVIRRHMEESRPPSLAPRRQGRADRTR